MSSRLHVIMLGQFEMWEEPSGSEESERRALSLPATARSQSLLAYLLLHRKSPHPREALAEMFWPGRPPQRARRSLSTALWRIRRCFAPDDPLHCDHQLVQIVLPGETVIDAEIFENQIRRAAGMAALQQAVARYAGEFLPGFYDDWVIRHREWLQALYQDALLQLMQGYEARGELKAALGAARQALMLDECNEAAHRTAMRAYAGMGQRAAALAQYQQCREALARELAVTPAPETLALHQTLLAQQETVRQNDGAPDVLTVRAPLLPKPFLPRRLGEEPPLVGRSQELEHLRNRWREAVQGHGRTVFVQGEAGIGKTRLLAALAAQVRARQGQIIGVQCYEYERGETYAALADVLREAIVLSDEGLLRELSAWQRANLARLAPELRLYSSDDAGYLVAAAAEQKQLLRALTRLLRHLARRAPLLLLIDDLQWAHESTLALLPALAREAELAPLLLVGAYRIEEVAPGDMLARIIARMETEGRAESLPLHRLAPQDLAQWLRGLDEEAVARIHRHTEGNPFFVLETVRALEEQGRIQRIDGAYRANDGRFGLPLPDSVRQTIRIRLAALTPAARQGLGVAAVIGRVFDLDVWMRVWGRDEEQALEALDQLLKAHLLEEGKGAFARDYAFEHHLVREAVYQDIPKRRRQQWHIATARTLETLRGGDAGVSAEIAFHYLRAEQLELARPWLLQAGDQAVAAAATAEALGFYRRALAGCPRDEAHRFERAVLARRIGDVHFQRGEYEQAERHLVQTLDLLNRTLPHEGFSLHRAVSGAFLRQTRHRLIPGGLRARRAAITPALKEEVAVYTSLGWMYSLQSRYEEYLLVSLRALNASEEADYARGIAVAATALGIAADFMAQFGLAEHFHRRVRAVAAEVAQPTDSGFVAFGQAYHAYLTGDEPVMLEQATLAAEKYRQAGDAHRWTLARMLQAYVLAYRGQLPEVKRIGEALAAAGEEMENAAARCAGEALLAAVARWWGEWEEAIAHYHRAISLAEQIPDHMSLVEHLAGLARCQLRLGRGQEAQESLSRARETAILHEVKGDVMGQYAVAALEAALWAAERQPEARARWLARAKKAVAEARKQAKAFRPAQPEVWRLCGRYQWLCGRTDAARRWWRKSLARAEAMEHRLDWAVTALEMGLHLDMPSLRAQGRAALEDSGAVGEIAFLEKAIEDTEKHEFSS